MGDWVLHIALCTSIAGLVLLTIVSESLEPPYSEISSINTGYIGKNVHLLGRITGIHEFKGGSLLLTFSEENHSVDVFIPYSVSTQLDFKPEINQSMDLIGTVEVYNGRLEVVVDKKSNIHLTENEG